MRLFVAAYPPAEVIDDLDGAVRTLAIWHAAADGVNVRLAPADQLHVTLVFLGEVPDERQPDVESAVAAGVATWSTGWVAPRARAVHRGPDRIRYDIAPGPPVLRLQGGGRFGRGRFTVLWTGLQGEVASLQNLSDAVRRQLKRAKLPFDDKPLRPHLTIARPGDRMPAEHLAADLASLKGYQGPQWTLDELRLVRSYQGPRPRYEYLFTFPLPGRS